MDNAKIDPQPTVTSRHLEEAFRYLVHLDLLQEALTSVLEEEGEAVPGDFSATVSTFREAGVLTYNHGVVLSFSTGGEFQVTIVRSAR
ncbi:hypothetical protein SAMN05443575_1472 [Jatrophihabitans endophyticus]|uniref:Uncharacterized protein n=1 Tax=Jatrophihabitans endophyticus TaxID=1206085 RepID=A0A1M5HCI8_9ACTN|nr:hypothetical protein [Jatrophihabitans endophyticus]SHG13598.1 hypothetical protein SAMN05443575_1472 [Jatrophihabitans endophyticus]